MPYRSGDRTSAGKVEFGRTAADYARHRAGFPESFFRRIVAEGWVFPGIRALDLGTGTGTVARGLARLGLDVVGLDPAEEMLEQAHALAVSEGVAAEFVAGCAEATGQPDGTFDLVAAGQCWHWFDRSAAAAEAMRILKPGGRLLIAHFDWLPIGNNIVAQTERLILAHNPDWKGAGSNGLYPRWHDDLRSAGFADVAGFSYDEPVSYSHEAWRGRIRASAGVAASLPADAVARFDAEHAEMLARDFPGEPLEVPHCVFAVSALRP